MARAFAAVLLVAVGLLLMVELAQARSPREPGTIVRTWSARWPAKGERHVYLKRFAAPPGLIRRVRVSVYGNRVLGPPFASFVACKDAPPGAQAQRTWLWDGQSVWVLLYLRPNRCEVAGTFVRVDVAMTTVGT